MSKAERVTQYLLRAHKIFTDLSGKNVPPLPIHDSSVVEVAKMLQMEARWDKLSYFSGEKINPQTYDIPDKMENAELPPGTKRLYVDGGCYRNGEPDQAARIAVATDDDVLLHQEIGNHTSNEAEFYALIAGLEIIKKSGYKKGITVFSDSRMAVKMSLGSYQSRTPELIVLKNIVQKMLKQEELQNVSLVWMPRSENKAGHYLERSSKTEVS